MQRVRYAVGALAMALISAARPPTTHSQFDEDFKFAWKSIGSDYAYFDRKATHWSDIPRLYQRDLASVRTKREFVTLLENVVDELYDPHAQLTVNTAASPCLVPSGADLWAEWRASDAVITEVRHGSDAERAGIRPGDIVIASKGLPITEAVERRMGRSYPHSVAAARDWALRSVLAGTHDTVRTLQLRRENMRQTVELPACHQSDTVAEAPLSYSEIEAGVGYIRLHDSLGRDDTVAAFDDALAHVRGTRALIIDLRDTPSGGNTAVARGILGRFVDRELPYQKHSLPSEERQTGIRRSWLELVSPRGPFIYTGPVTVLVDHWTGSMGEGLAIGFDGTGRGTVIGTAMAGLLGATEHVILPHSGIGINVPTERLYHVNGRPREAFRPSVAVDVADTTSMNDPFIATALRTLPLR